MPKSLQTIIAVVLTVAVILPATRGDHPPALAATPVSACQSVTPQSVSAYATAIDRALRYANADARANGENGSYAVAARNSRDLLDRAKKRVEDGAAKLRSSATSCPEIIFCRETISYREITSCPATTS